MSNILIFKTNIQREPDKFRLGAMLEEKAEIDTWTLDLSDIDCVLRVVSEIANPEEIISIAKTAGYCCEELGDNIKSQNSEL